MLSEIAVAGSVNYGSEGKFFRRFESTQSRFRNLSPVDVILIFKDVMSIFINITVITSSLAWRYCHYDNLLVIIIFNAPWKLLVQKSQKGIPSTLSIENVDKDFWKWEKVDQAGRPLPPKILSILVGLTLKLVSLCGIISILEEIWTVCFISEYICVSSLEIYVW